MTKMWKLLTYILAVTLFLSCTDEQKKSKLSTQTINYADFSISYTDSTFEKKFGSCLNNIDCAEVKINFPQFIAENEALELINNSIISQLLKDNDEETAYQSFDEISDSLFSQYKNVQKEFSDYKTAWSIVKNTTVAGVVNNFLSIKNEVVIYTGGASNYYNVTLSVFDLKSGKKQSISSFINLNKMDEFLKIGEREFRKIKNISEGQPLKETGFWFEKDVFYLPDNFNISDSGFVFFYNLYEIAPRSEGFTDLFIPKDELKEILIDDNFYK